MRHDGSRGDRVILRGLRSVGAVLLALLVAFALVVLVEGYSALVHPFPDGDFVMAEHVADYPQWVLATAVLMWAGTVLVAVWLATRLGTARHPGHGWVVGLFLLLMVSFNLSMLPYPSWFVVANYLLFPLAIVLGIRWGRAPRSIAAA